MLATSPHQKPGQHKAMAMLTFSFALFLCYIPFSTLCVYARVQCDHNPAANDLAFGLVFILFGWPRFFTLWPKGKKGNTKIQTRAWLMDFCVLLTHTQTHTTADTHAVHKRGALKSIWSNSSKTRLSLWCRCRIVVKHIVGNERRLEKGQGAHTAWTVSVWDHRQLLGNF